MSAEPLLTYALAEVKEMAKTKPLPLKRGGSETSSTEAPETASQPDYSPSIFYSSTTRPATMRSLLRPATPGIGNLRIWRNIRDMPPRGRLVTMHEGCEDHEITVVEYEVNIVNDGFPFAPNPQMYVFVPATNTGYFQLMSQTTIKVTLPLTSFKDIECIRDSFVTLTTVEEDETAEDWVGFIREFTRGARERCRAFHELIRDIPVGRRPTHSAEIDVCAGALKHEFMRALDDAMDAGEAFRQCSNKAGFKRAKEGGAE